MAQGDWLDELLDEIYQDKNTLGDFPIEREVASTVIRKRMAQERIEAYRDMASKGGTGTIMRLYALSRAQELEQRQQGGDSK